MHESGPRRPFASISSAPAVGGGVSFEGAQRLAPIASEGSPSGIHPFVDQLGSNLDGIRDELHRHSYIGGHFNSATWVDEFNAYLQGKGKRCCFEFLGLLAMRRCIGIAIVANRSCFFRTTLRALRSE